MSLNVLRSCASSWRASSASLLTSLPPASWLLCWRAGWLAVGIAFAALNWAAERELYVLFDGQYHPTQEWFLTSLKTLQTFPFERNLRRMAIYVLRASGNQLLKNMEKK